MAGFVQSIRSFCGSLKCQLRLVLRRRKGFYKKEEAGHKQLAAAGRLLGLETGFNLHGFARWKSKAGPLKCSLEYRVWETWNYRSLTWRSNLDRKWSVGV